MKGQALNIAIFGIVSFWLCNSLYAWENKKTHPAITDKAISVSVIDNYLKTQLDLANGVLSEFDWDFPVDIKKRIKAGKADPDKTTRNILEWTRVGSIIEDETLLQVRSRHHFHDPIRNTGLDNRTDYPDWEGAPTRNAGCKLRLGG